jgi:hypothetical protein
VPSVSTCCLSGLTASPLSVRVRYVRYERQETLTEILQFNVIGFSITETFIFKGALLRIFQTSYFDFGLFCLLGGDFLVLLSKRQ